MNEDSQKFPGIEHLVRLLKLSSPMERRKLLRSIGKQYPDQFPEIFKKSFQAEDIEFFNEKQLLELADITDNTVLALVLYELSPEFQKYYLGLMTSFKAKEIQYILDNFEKAQIHRDIDKAKSHLEELVKTHFLS